MVKSKLNINESFICKIWDGGEQFYSNLKTTEGEGVKILEHGRRNYDAGPDYKDARIRIGDKIYRGDIEVHREFKDWHAHNHKRDSKYNSVILQVVMWDSTDKKRPTLRIKRNLPTVCLSNFLKRSIHQVWQEIIDKPDQRFRLPCRDLNKKVDDDTVETFLAKLAIQRLELKTERIRERLVEMASERSGLPHNSILDSRLNKLQDWEQVFYEFTFEALGYSKNKEPMLKLARNLRLEAIRKIVHSHHDDQLLAVRTLLYGASGLLFDLKLRNKYANKLKDLWDKLKEHLKTQLVLKAEWQFFRLRPQNFPSVRLAYGADLISNMLHEKLFEKVILEFDKQEFHVRKVYRSVLALFEFCSGRAAEVQHVGDYLSFFDNEKNLKYRHIGKERRTDILVNVVIPLVYLYSSVFSKELMKENIILFYRTLKTSTDNSVLKLMKSQLTANRQIKINTPGMQQALIQLYSFYCMRERCLECEIGKRIFKDSGYEYKIIFY